jgi:hypothetical protein
MVGAWSTGARRRVAGAAVTTVNPPATVAWVTVRHVTKTWRIEEVFNCAYVSARWEGVWRSRCIN